MNLDALGFTMFYKIADMLIERTDRERDNNFIYSNMIYNVIEICKRSKTFKI